MKKKSFVAVMLTLAFIMLACYSVNSVASGASRAAECWEYRTEKGEAYGMDLSLLNRLGSEGWELITLDYHSYYIFKRRLP